MADPVKTDDIGDRRLVEQNNHMCFEQKEVRNEVVGEGQGLGSSEEDESRVNAVAEDVNIVPGGEIKVHSELQLIPQQLPQGPTVCWERFLPVRSLKVLLVENDDSTRHVVSALLRNCSYEVTAVSNGFHAWKILEDLSNHIDIIIAEVVMPFISGIALLCKIRSHKTFKNIPVVMMSSHDSMGIVFKCLSNGAVDFLVKPIRKNELKNLWQHVWRRCHSSSGSGSESGTQSRKSVKLRSVEMSDNHTATASSDEQDDRCNGSNIRDGSDNDSGTQSSWTKRAAEVDSPEPDSTCAQVIHMKPEAIGNQQVHATETKECQEHDQQLDLDIRVSDIHVKLSAQPTNERQNGSPEVDSKLFDGLTEQNNELLSRKLRALDSNSSCAIAGLTNPQIESRTFDGPSGLSSISKLKDKVKCDSGQLSSLELRLRMLKGVEDNGNTEHDDHTVLRHTDSSAFSKYDTASSDQGPTGNVGSCSPLDNSSVAPKTEIRQNFPSHSNSNPPIQQSNGSSNNNDMASTTYVNLKQESLNKKSESVSAFKCLDPPQQLSPGRKDDVRVDTNHGQQPKGSKQQVQVQHHHHYYHHFHHHVKDMNQHQQDCDDETSLKNMAVAAPQCGSSNAFGGPINGDTGNFSLNRSGSGSNHGSNGQNGESTALNAEPLNVESDNRDARNSGNGGSISGRIGEDAGDEDLVAQKEVALYKFCQKRKERPSEKKVQYNSRKKPAGQQPHIEGQFVRRIKSNSNASKDNHSNDRVSEANSDDSIR